MKSAKWRNGVAKAYGSENISMKSTSARTMKMK
jgi:hypothetical protein